MTDTLCTISWEVAGVAFDGICLRVDGTLGMGYMTDGAVGLGVYRIRGDGLLTGTWSVAGLPGTGTEVLTPVR